MKKIYYYMRLLLNPVKLKVPDFAWVLAVFRRRTFAPLFFIVFWGLAVNSCDFEPAEYISIYMINKTKETLLVYAGTNILFFGIPSAFIPAGGEQSVMVKKGESVIVYGKNTNRQYGSRSFNFETQWEIN